MLEQITPLDGAALLAFLAIWAGYSVLFDGRLRRSGSINAQMIAEHAESLSGGHDRENS